MSEEIVNELSEATKLALASAGKHRSAWLGGFGLDARLARIVSQASEPMLAQMRLAWWRDQLGIPVENRPSGDAVLELVGECWAGHEGALRKLVDGWEALLAEPPLSRDAAFAFAEGRGAINAALARKSGTDPHTAARAGRTWALAELASRSSREGEREFVLGLARENDEATLALPRSMRPLAVLLGLARRSMARGGQPFLGDRWSPLVAMRLGMFGR